MFYDDVRDFEDLGRTYTAQFVDSNVNRLEQIAAKYGITPHRGCREALGTLVESKHREIGGNGQIEITDAELDAAFKAFTDK